MIKAFGLVTVFMLVIFLAGKTIGENQALFIAYIAVTMSSSYLLPIVVAIYTRHWWWLAAIPFLASVVFAFPSSFVAYNGCRAGHEEAVWAMRTIPAMWLGEILLANDTMSCRDF